MKYNEQKELRNKTEIERAMREQKLEEERARLKKEGVKNLMTSTKKKEDEGEGEEHDEPKSSPMRKKDTTAAKALEELESKKIKNREKNIIRDIDRQEDIYRNIEKIKVEDKTIHEPSDVSLISALTIESLL